MQKTSWSVEKRKTRECAGRREKCSLEHEGRLYPALTRHENSLFNPRVAFLCSALGLTPGKTQGLLDARGREGHVKASHTFSTARKMAGWLWGAHGEPMMLCLVSVLLGDRAAMGVGDRREKPSSGPELK